MDLLQKELERKKKELQGSGKSRYVRASDLRRRREEAQAPGAKKLKTTKDATENSTKLDSTKPLPTTVTYVVASSSSSDGLDEVAQLTPQEVTEKLRVMGLPVRIFGEVSQQGDGSRRNRLRQALAQHNETLAGLKEKDEFRLEKGHSIRNTFLEKESVDTTEASGLLRGNGKEDNSKAKAEIDDDDKTLPTDPHKKIYKYFKTLLRQWEDDLSKRPEEVKRSVAGKNETKTMQQCRDYINPLFKQCKKRQLEEGQLNNYVRIVDYCVEGEFVKAHDAYMDVAIGRAAWPIGVTMVGIHARTGRAKIESKNVAHVMNSELQRKCIWGIKRLMTYAQSKRPDIHPSKKVVN